MSGGLRRFLDLPWSRLLAEFVIIVVGVAVGLAVDSARQARSDSERAAQYLDQIRADLATGSEAVDDQIARTRTIAGSAQRLLEGLNQAELPPTDSLRAWWGDLFSLATYRPSTVTIDALVDGGDLRLIRAPEIRQAIMAYRERAGLAEVASTIANDIASRAVSRMGEDMSLANLMFDRDEVRLPIDWAAVAQDPALHSQIVIIRVGAASTAQELSAVRSAGADLEALIDEALR